MHLQKFNTNIKNALLQTTEALRGDFIFALFNSLLKIVVRMSWINYNYASQFIKKMDYFGKEIFYDANLKITPENREQGLWDLLNMG